MSATARALRRDAAGRALLAALVFALGVGAAIQLAFSDFDLTASVALPAVLASMALAAARPAVGALILLALFSDALYFGTYGLTLPTGQLVPADVLLIGWWTMTAMAALWHRGEILLPSPVTRWIAVVYPAVLAFYLLYTWMSFGPGPTEMLRSARPFLYLTLYVPLAFWLRAPEAIDDLLRLALRLALIAVAIQLFVYAAGVDVEPYGLFYEWQVWRGSFEGFDRSHQPFFGLNLILVGGCITLGFGERLRARRLGWAACAGLLLLSAAITFGRGFWGAMLVASLTAIAVAGRRARAAPALTVTAAVLFAVASLLALAGASGFDIPGLGGAILDRGLLGADSIRYMEGTLGDRYDNVNREIIREHPWLGIGFYLGLGTASDIDLADTGHNLYADLMLRMGGAGLLFFGLLLALFLRRCRRALSMEMPAAHRAAVVGCLGAALGSLAWGISSSHLINRRGMLEMALMMAVVEVIIHIASRRAEADSAPARPVAA